MIDPAALAYDDAGLMPGVIQDADSGNVLMVGYLNRDAVRKTLATGEVHFWSRSREELWRKGETSGNTLNLVEIDADCDRDALLIRAIPAGPTCHTGDASCFGPESAAPGQGFARLDRLWRTITLRAAQRPEGSYTAELLDGGVDAVGRKVMEEAAELLIAAKNHAAGTEGANRLIEEAADVLFHLLVLLAERGVTPTAVLGELDARSHRD